MLASMAQYKQRPTKTISKKMTKNELTTAFGDQLVPQNVRISVSLRDAIRDEAFLQRKSLQEVYAEALTLWLNQDAPDESDSDEGDGNPGLPIDV